jgi:hypothetical protein
MRSDELAHIRADVHQAILEAQRHDPAVTLEILWRLFDRVGELATYTDPTGVHAGIRLEFGNFVRPAPSAQWWAGDLLHDVQLRAVSKVPYGEPVDDEQEDHR